MGSGVLQFLFLGLLLSFSSYLSIYHSKFQFNFWLSFQKFQQDQLEQHQGKMFQDSIVTVGTNGKCNNLGEESHSESNKNNLQLAPPSSCTSSPQKIQIKSGSDILNRYNYRRKHNMWTNFNYHNFYQKLNCDVSSSRENNFKTFLEQQCKNTRNFIWKDFKVDFLFYEKTGRFAFKMCFRFCFSDRCKTPFWTATESN